MTNSNVQNYLIDSLKLNKNSYNKLVNASHPFPCGIWQKNVHNNQKYIKCTSCKFMVHIKCNGTTVEEYKNAFKNKYAFRDIFNYLSLNDY